MTTTKLNCGEENMASMRGQCVDHLALANAKDEGGASRDERAVLKPYASAVNIY